MVTKQDHTLQRDKEKYIYGKESAHLSTRGKKFQDFDQRETGQIKRCEKHQHQDSS